MKSHFIDLDILIKNDSKAWIVDKNNPNIPILKIDNSDLSVFKSGILKSQNNKMSFNGKTFYLSNEFMNRLKSKAKKHKSDFSNLGISFQEFLNPELIENVKFEIDLSILKNIVNTNDDIYIFCSKNSKENFKNQILKLEEEFEKIGLTIKKFYYLSETFFNKDEDQMAFIKNKVILQHLIGLKVDGDKFIDENIDEYSEIFYYDDNLSSTKLSLDINGIFEKFTMNTEKSIKESIKLKVQNSDKILNIKEFTNNKANKFKESSVQLEFSNLIKSFENFNPFSSSSPR
jgi:YHS domain-containing protein